MTNAEQVAKGQKCHRCNGRITGGRVVSPYTSNVLWPCYLDPIHASCLTHLECYPSQKKIRVRVEFKKEDLWVGVFWRTNRSKWESTLTLWICLIPMVPIVVTWKREKEGWGDR